MLVNLLITEYGWEVGLTPSLCETVVTLAISPDRPATVVYFCKFLQYMYIYVKPMKKDIFSFFLKNILHCQKGKDYLALCELLELNDVHHTLPPSHNTSIPRSCFSFPSSSHFSHCNSLQLSCSYLILCI